MFGFLPDIVIFVSKRIMGDNRYIYRLKKFEKAIADLCCRFESVKIAILHKTARELAFSEIVDFRTLYKNYSHQSFFIKEVALDWLLKA